MFLTEFTSPYSRLVLRKDEICLSRLMSTKLQSTDTPKSVAMAKLHPVQHYVKYSSTLFMVQISHSVEHLGSSMTWRREDVDVKLTPFGSRRPICPRHARTQGNPIFIQSTIQTKILQPAIIQNTKGAYSRPFKCSQPTLPSHTTGL